MATVLHRTTKQLIYSVHTPDYSAADWIHNPNLSVVEGVPIECWIVEGDSVREMTTEEKDSCLLGCCKTRKYAAIDNKTSELIAQGFDYGGNIFSLSAESQNRIIGTHQVKDDPVMVYPIKWNTLDDSNVIELDATGLHSFYLAALGTYRGHVDFGTSLKDQVRSAATIVEVDAVVDNR